MRSRNFVTGLLVFHRRNSTFIEFRANKVVADWCRWTCVKDVQKSLKVQ